MRQLFAQQIQSMLEDTDSELSELDNFDVGSFEDASAGGMSVEEPEEPEDSSKNSEEVESFSGYRCPIQGQYLNIGQFSPGAATDARHKGGHNGIDFMAPRGTPIFPIAPGIVSRVGSNPAGGNTVNTSHEDGKITAYYAHMDSIHVKANDEVDYNTVLGTVGNSGNANITAPHLHLQMWENGALINPASKFFVEPYNQKEVMLASKDKNYIRRAFLSSYNLIK